MNPPAIEARIRNCEACGLCKSRKRTVPGAGPVNARLVIVGEGPGQHEDEQGLPFVGPSGQLLTDVLRLLEHERSEVFVTNIVKCRPPGNRNPLPDEIASCRPFLIEQLESIEPTCVLALGKVAANVLTYPSGFDSMLPLRLLRKYTQRMRDLDLPVVCTYHPAYVLRQNDPRTYHKFKQDIARAFRVAEGKVYDVPEF